MPERDLVIGTRGSPLALWQTEHVAQCFRAIHPKLGIQVERITTQGDLVLDRALDRATDKGFFVKEIEAALLENRIALAVHSLKDMPTELPEGLMLGAILERADARDVLVVADGAGTLLELPHGAVVGTSSLRRRAQLLAVRPDLKIVDMRGNVDTRLHKLRAGEFDAIVLAAAGLLRLDYADAIAEYLPVDIMTPAVGQGALCVEVRADDAATRALIAPLDHLPTRQAVLAERAFLHRLEGGCQVPVGAYAEVEGRRLGLRGLVASLDGSQVLRQEIGGPAEQGARLGTALAEQMLAAGAQTILEEVYHGR